MNPRGPFRAAAPICDGDVLSVLWWHRSGAKESLVFHNGVALGDIHRGDPSELSAAVAAACMRWGAGFYLSQVESLTEATTEAVSMLVGLRLAHNISPAACRALLDWRTEITSVLVLYAPRPGFPVGGFS